MSKKVLVSGGMGYIGSHTVCELVEQGFEPIIVDNLSNSNLRALEGMESICGRKIPFYQGNLCDLSLVKNVFEKEKNITSVIHFAALKAVGESVEKSILYYQNNITSLLNLLQVCEEQQVNQFVFSSSCTVYGQPDHLPVDESAPIMEAESPYGSTKQIGEQILSQVSQHTNLNVISLRYFNPIGAHSGAKIGEYPNGIPNNLVPFITQAAAGKRTALTVFGDDYNTKDGTCVRDYIHICDLAKAHVLACKRLNNNTSNKKYEVFNLGSGTGYTVKEVLDTFEKVNNTKVPYVIGKRRKGDIEKIFADNKKAEKILGWKAEETLESMLQSAWKWEQQLS